MRMSGISIQILRMPAQITHLTLLPRDATHLDGSKAQIESFCNLSAPALCLKPLIWAGEFNT